MTNEEKLDLFADLIDPFAEILSDKEVQEVVFSGKPTLLIVKVALKKHKTAVIQIMARIEGVPVEQYEITWDLPKKLVNLLNKPEIQDLFTLQGRQKGVGSSGSATENTKDGAN